jgi:hypothetical protein
MNRDDDEARGDKLSVCIKVNGRELWVKLTREEIVELLGLSAIGEPEDASKLEH